MHLEHLRRVRRAAANALADTLERVGVWMCAKGSRIRPPYDGPMCPDCQMVAEAPEDETCWMCDQRAEHNAAMAYLHGEPA